MSVFSIFILYFWKKMTREKKLEAIYKEMANKELMLGCFYFSNVTRQKEIYDWSIWSNYIGEIIGHPVMIGDVIKRIKENREISYWEYLVKLLGQLSRPWLRRELGLSIDDQAQECVNFVYSLIQK